MDSNGAAAGSDWHTQRGRDGLPGLALGAQPLYFIATEDTRATAELNATLAGCLDAGNGSLDNEFPLVVDGQDALHGSDCIAARWLAVLAVKPNWLGARAAKTRRSTVSLPDLPG